MRNARIALVRHGRASAGWDMAIDPGLDDLGRSQAETVAHQLDLKFVDLKFIATPVEIVTSPLLRCQQTAAAFARRRDVVPRICNEVAEIPSPDGVVMSARIDWLRRAMQGTWADLGSNYVAFRNSTVEFVRAINSDTVIFSHFIAINAVIGAITGDDRLVIRRLDNCSVTLVERDSSGQLHIVEDGREADTLIR